MEDKLQAPALAAEVAADQESMSAGSQAAAANGQSEAEAAKATTPTTTADIELEGLALSSSITELVYALEAVSTLIFEIQVGVLLCSACLCNGGTRLSSRNSNPMTR